MATSAMVLIEPDPFIGVGNKVSSYVPRYGEDTEAEYDAKKKLAHGENFNLSDITDVSRPLNGLSVKPNTHAWVQVLRSDGTPILLFNALGQTLGKMEQSGVYGNKPLTGAAAGEDYNRAEADAAAQGAKSDSSSNKKSVAEANPLEYGSDGPNSAAWTDWILQSVREQRIEKTQVVETFGDTYFYAFGERPRALEFTGLLMNTLDYNWRAIFWENWDRFFRATKLIEAGARMYIGWEDVIVEGYPINAAASETASSPNAMTFRFTFYITNYINTSSQAGFVSQKAARIARIRGGYLGGADTGTPTYLKEPTRLIEYIGPYGATLAGGALEKGALALAGDKPSRLAQTMARFAGQTFASAVSNAQKGLYAFATGPGPTSAFLTNWLRYETYTAAKFWKDYGFRVAEDAANFKSGEINAWFGLLGNILSRLDKGSATQELEAKGGAYHGDLGTANANWLGRRGGFDPASGRDWVNVLKAGSVDKIIGSLSYAMPSVSGYEDNTVYATAKSKGRPAGATMVHLSPHKASSLAITAPFFDY